jgi:hypothetical protein
MLRPASLGSAVAPEPYGAGHPARNDQELLPELLDQLLAVETVGIEPTSANPSALASEAAARLPRSAAGHGAVDQE